MGTRRKHVSDVYAYCANVKTEWHAGREDFCVKLVDDDGSVIDFERFACDADGFLTPKNWYAAMGVAIGYHGAAAAAKDPSRPTLLFGNAEAPSRAAR